MLMEKWFYSIYNGGNGGNGDGFPTKLNN